MNTFSSRIRLMRIAKRMSQIQLAELVDISQPFLSDIETGKRRPSLDVLERLCDTLGCSADYLLGLPQDGSNTILKQNQLPHVLSPEILRIVKERNISECELRTALKVTSIIRNESAHAAK